MTRYDTTGNDGMDGAAALCDAGVATTPEDWPAGIGVHTATPANTAGIGIGFARDMTASIGVVARAGSVTGAAASQLENTCWRYANAKAGSAE